jgi:hypothetical protein
MEEKVVDNWKVEKSQVAVPMTLVKAWEKAVEARRARESVQRKNLER